MYIIKIVIKNVTKDQSEQNLMPNILNIKWLCCMNNFVDKFYYWETDEC